MSEVIKVNINDTSSLKDAVAQAVRQLGGFGKFINPGERVLLKPNFNTADPFPGGHQPGFFEGRG
jgi:uncharacterized protein (DUF362 family)